MMRDVPTGEVLTIRDSDHMKAKASVANTEGIENTFAYLGLKQWAHSKANRQEVRPLNRNITRCDVAKTFIALA
mgnify:CR=1 FL=1